MPPDGVTTYTTCTRTICHLFDNGVDCAEANILDERGGETSCRKTVGWRIVLSIGNLVLLVLWSGSMDDRCDPVTQTIHLPRQQLHSIRIICGQYDQLHSQSYIPKCSYI